VIPYGIMSSRSGEADCKLLYPVTLYFTTVTDVDASSNRLFYVGYTHS